MEQKTIESNFKAEVYKSVNEFQKRDGLKLLNQLKLTFSGRKLQTVIDVGSGCGNLTSLISEYLDCSEIIGMDISADMVDYARKNYTRSNLRFEEASITDEFDDLFKKLKINSNVDLIVSNHCLHWIKEKHSEALKNMYGLLSPGGEAHFVVYAGAKMMPLWAKTLCSPAWIKYFPELANLEEEDAVKWVFPNPRSEMNAWKSVAFDIGFVDIDLKFEETSCILESIKHAYGNTLTVKAVVVMSVFILAACKGASAQIFDRIPGEKMEDFYLHFVKVFHDSHVAQECYPKFCCAYDIAVMQLTKPENNNCLKFSANCS